MKKIYSFAERLKELREEKNLSMSELAKKIGVSANTISRWESGKRKPNIDALVILSMCFEVSVDYLCGLED